MAQEKLIDLRPIVKALLRRWWWIVIPTVVAMVAAFFISKLLPSVYQSTALVIVRNPVYNVELEPKFETVDMSAQVYLGYPELAISDELISDVYDSLDPKPADVETLLGFRSRLEVEKGEDPRMLYLTASASSPDEAAYIANAWAEAFVARAEEVYGNQPDTQLAFFEAQVTSTKADYDQAQQAMLDYVAENNQTLVQNQLNSLNQMQIDKLAMQRSIDYLLKDIRDFRTQLANRPSSEVTTLADELTILGLQIEMYRVQDGLPVLLQITETPVLESQPLNERIALLDLFTQLLNEQSAELDEELKALEPKMAELNLLQAQLQTRIAELTRIRDMARDIYNTLLLKYEEVQITAQETTKQTRIASAAVAPSVPSAPNPKVNAVVAGLVAFVLAVGVVLVFEFWTKGINLVAKPVDSE